VNIFCAKDAVEEEREVGGLREASKLRAVVQTNVNDPFDPNCF